MARTKLPIEEREALIRDAFRVLTGKPAERIHYPGGASRKTCLVTTGSETFALSRRQSAGRARLEYEVLAGLKKSAAAVAEPVAWHDRWVLTRYVQSTRLPEAFKIAKTDTAKTKLSVAALKSLLDIHLAGRNGLSHLPLPKIGSTLEWRQRFVALPFELADRYGVMPPELDRDKALGLLSNVVYRFVKWDSRPGNAMVKTNGAPVWIDFEYCGLRNPLDDVAWFIADEWQAGELGQLWQETVTATTAAGMTGAFATTEFIERYLATYCLLHICVRMSLVLDRTQKGARGDASRERALDLVGTNRACINALTNGAKFFGQRSDCWRKADDFLASLAEVAFQAIATNAG